DWMKNDIDHFILARLEAKDMTPNELADKRALLRRVYFDLIGLPPTPEEVTAFLQDQSSNAFENVVDRLLASPRYGERWGRHWLDIARYSDTKGQFDRRRESSVYPYAWTYRDYVIRAFNEDKPYNQFILEQLAADKLHPGADKSALAALGFLTVGDHFNGNLSDIINDRIDVTTKAFLGLTVSCARCHDHKFDPIPQADYYSLHGIFASSVEPAFKQETSDPKTNPGYEEYLKQRAELDARILNVRTQNMTMMFGDYKRLAGIYLYATQMAEKDRDAYLTKSGADLSVLKHWQQVSRGGGRRAMSIFVLWNALTRIPGARFAMQGPRFLSNLPQRELASRLNPYVLDAFKGKSPHSLAEAAVIYGNLFAKNDSAWQATLAIVLEDAMFRFLPQKQRGQFFALREQSDMLELIHPGAPARAMMLADTLTPKDSPVFIRGQAENPGETVPRRFLEALSGPNRPVFTNGSGRLELAQAIASKNNSLTARVLVNRVWMHHFGEGFVTTPDDFGNQSAPPSHPELLDFLASHFMENGWSLKKLHKLILLSAAYQQSSKNNPVYAEKDPYNRLLWRANVRRLEFEPLRDSILYLGGNLDLTVGGHPVDLSQGTHKSQRPARTAMLNRVREFRLAGGSRRTIYGYVDRADLYEELNTFDFANPSAPMGRRYETIVPQQGLFLMNSPLVLEQVRKVVNRDEFKTQRKPVDRVRYLYELFFQRLPTDEEVRVGVEFVSAHSRDETESRASSSESASVSGVTNDHGLEKPASAGTRGTRRPLGRWQEYAHALLLTNEASFVN
ncbi:MAG: DUF1549 and DUF1553 domain-containing protein, partial [Verrucomicrobiota bacterium]